MTGKWENELVGEGWKVGGGNSERGRWVDSGGDREEEQGEGEQGEGEQGEGGQGEGGTMRGGTGRGGTGRTNL